MDFLNIKEQIKSKGYTYESFGNEVGLTKTSVARIASGNQTPGFDTLKKMADVLDIDIRELFKPTKRGAIMNGFVEHRGEVYRINSESDLKRLLSLINGG